MIYAKLLLTAIFWGGTFIAGRTIAGSVHPVIAAFIRFSIASVCLLALVIKNEGHLPLLKRHQIIVILALGSTGVFAYNILFFSGLKYIGAARASIIIANNPILISLLSTIFFKESLNWIKAAGICLSVAGAIVVISNGHLGNVNSYNFGSGELLIFGCVLSWVTYSLIGKKAMASLSPLICVAYSAVAGTMLLLLPALHFGLSYRIINYAYTDWISLIYLGIFGTVLGFFWYYQGIEKIGPMRASVFINFVPISAIVLSYFILHEPLSLSLVFGGAMVIVGVCFTNASQVIVDFWLTVLMRSHQQDEN